MKIVTIVGARPQFVKAALLSARLDREPQIDERLVHTGQHYDENMSQVFFDELGIKPPAHRLDVGSGSHAAQTGEMMRRLEPIIVGEAPSCVLVYGDTNTTLAGALTAAKINVPVVHVEAGLRSFDRTMPEEVNRVVTDHLATLLFAVNEGGVAQLAREGITENVWAVGDLMADLVSSTLATLPPKSSIATMLGLRRNGYVLATVHRAGNTDDPKVFGSILEALRQLDLPVVFPVHPRVRGLTETILRNRRGSVIAIDPVSYNEMLALQRDSCLIVTDSGGIQKEAYILGIPCVTLRRQTEWPETLGGDWNVLAGTHTEDILACADVQRNRRVATGRSRPDRSAFGDGDTASRITACLLNWHAGTAAAAGRLTGSCA